MSEINSWKIFFDNYAPHYMEESFTQNTIEEVDFIEEEFKLPKKAAIIDVGCGTGRHVLELARRGYKVTGLDISARMLDEGRKVSEAENLEVNFIQANAVNFTLIDKFAACICLCEGAFGLLSMHEKPFVRDQKILGNIYSVLKPGAKFILTALNGLKKIREFSEEDVEKGRFDPIDIVEIYSLSEMLEEAPEGITIKEKGFLASELKMMLEKAGFRVENIYGGTAGSWKRERLKMDEMEVMIISHKEN